MSWIYDIGKRWEFGCWLYHRGYFHNQGDMLAYFHDPLKWLDDQPDNTFRADYEQELAA